MQKGRTYYSERIAGSHGNYRKPVRYDLTDGYVGISQIEDDKVVDRVLLSPAQVKALTEFVEQKHR